MTTLTTLLASAATLAAAALVPAARADTPGEIKNVVLVHGGFVDGSGWHGVYDILKRDGYNVIVVQNPTISLAADVAATSSAIAAQDGPVVLVGHSYGGVVITEAGNDPKVEPLVYIAAFAPDAGESVQSLIANPPPGAPVPPILPPQDGFLFLDRAKFAASFAVDVDADDRGLHGGLAGSLGRRGPVRRGDRAGVENQAELLSRRLRRPHDPARAQRRWRTVPVQGRCRRPAVTRSTSRTRPRSPRSSSAPPPQPRRSTSPGAAPGRVELRLAPSSSPGCSIAARKAV